MARATATSAEHWLWRAWSSHTAASHWSWRLLLAGADQDGYQVPDPQRLTDALEAAALKELPPDGVLELANAFCGGNLGADDVERWAETRRRAERVEAERHEQRRVDRAARTQSQVRVGPFFVDTGTIPETCPCCRQQIIDPISWEIAMFRAGLG